MKFDKEKFEEGLRKAVADKGEDFVYKKSEEQHYCRYSNVDNPEEHCLIGQALINAGYTYEEWWENYGAASLLDELDAPDAVCNAAERAQNFQDEKHTWRFALDAYFAEVDKNPRKVVD